MTTMYGEPCAPSEPLYWLGQRFLADTLPGHKVPRRDLRLLTVLKGIEDAIFAAFGGKP